MNLLTNCAFLDGASGWSAAAPLALSVDETVRGAPGRAALVASGATTATNQTQVLTCAVDGRASVVAGREYEITASVFASVNGAAVWPEVWATWRNAGGAVVLNQPIGVVAAQIDRHGEARLGVRNSYRRVRSRAAAPAGAVTAELSMSVTPAASGAAVVLAVVKPMIAEAFTPWPITFDPGLTTNPDLGLPIWPPLRPFSAGPGGERQADRVEFGEGPGRPSRRRLTADPARQFSGSLSLDPIDRAILEDFHRATPGDFWFVEPDSDRLCVASFAADGAPRMTEDKGEAATVTVGLWLETA